MMLAAFNQLQDEFPCIWGVFGYGSDAELTPAEIDRALSRAAEHGGLLGSWGMTSAITAELQHVITHVRTEASAIAVECAHGAIGSKAIRDGTRTVPLSPVSTVTFYLSPGVLYEHVALLARVVNDAPTLEQASTILLDMGVRSEYAFELEMQRQGTRRFDEAQR